MTAAAADQKLSGCGDGRDWTDFGRAYFDIVPRQTPDFRMAFAEASRVETWEAEHGRRSSLPQIVEGAETGRTLDQLCATEIAQRN